MNGRTVFVLVERQLNALKESFRRPNGKPIPQSVSKRFEVVDRLRRMRDGFSHGSAAEKCESRSN